MVFAYDESNTKRLVNDTGLFYCYLIYGGKFYVGFSNSFDLGSFDECSGSF